jgi:hypothetical protein
MVIMAISVKAVAAVKVITVEVVAAVAVIIVVAADWVEPLRKKAATAAEGRLVTFSK